jgi:hypothetical protein
MKKLLCVVPALLLFAMISAPNARADSYTPTLICGNLPGNGGCFPFPVASDKTVSFPAPILSVSTAPFAPSPINVQLPAADSPMDTYTWNLEVINIPPVPYENFAEQLTIYDQTTHLTSVGSITAPGSLTTGDADFGTLTFSPVSAATPEPAPVLLMLFGAGVIVFVRKRFATHIPSTA